MRGFRANEKERRGGVGCGVAKKSGMNEDLRAKGREFDFFSAKTSGGKLFKIFLPHRFIFYSRHQIFYFYFSPSQISIHFARRFVPKKKKTDTH